MLEATRQAAGFDETARQPRRTIVIALLLGASLAFKLSNMAFAIPICVVYLHRLFSNSRPLWKQALITVAGLAVPLIPFSLFIFLLTRSPVFPLYNGSSSRPIGRPKTSSIRVGVPRALLRLFAGRFFFFSRRSGSLKSQFTEADCLWASSSPLSVCLLYDATNASGHSALSLFRVRYCGVRQADTSVMVSTWSY